MNEDSGNNWPAGPGEKVERRGKKRWCDNNVGGILMACDKGSTCLKLSGSRVNQSTINLRRLFVIARGISRVWVVTVFLAMHTNRVLRWNGMDTCVL